MTISNVENDEWYMPALMETRVVIANCDRESIAGEWRITVSMKTHDRPLEVLQHLQRV